MNVAEQGHKKFCGNVLVNKTVIVRFQLVFKLSAGQRCFLGWVLKVKKGHIQPG